MGSTQLLKKKKTKHFTGEKTLMFKKGHALDLLEEMSCNKAQLVHPADSRRKQFGKLNLYSQWIPEDII